MRKRLLAALIGVGAGAVLLAAYFALLKSGVAIRPEVMLGGSAALVFAGAVALFALVAMDRPAYANPRAALLLNEEPATQYIFRFRAPDVLPVIARPEMSVGEMLVRYGDAFKTTPDKMAKAIGVTIKGSAKKPFATITLQQLFATLSPFNLQHVLLMNEKDEFVGYIPGKRAAKEFVGDKAVEKIDKFIVKVLVDPATCGVLRELGGVTRDDTIGETDDARLAEAKIWANENVQGLVIHKHLKPVGFISKVDVLRLNAGRL